MAYSTRSDIEARFGTVNVAKWADVNASEDETEITARIAQAIADADTDIDSRLRNGPYVLPFETTPPEITLISALLAGVHLFSVRGSQDTDSDGMPIDRMSTVRADVDRRITSIMNGGIVLDAALACESRPIVNRCHHRRPRYGY